MSTQQSGFTTWSRSKKTRRSVLFADVVSQAVITAGGVGTIIAVLGVCLFLVWVALPLFQSAAITETRDLPRLSEQPLLGFNIDEYQVLGWALRRDGVLQTFRTDTGEVVYEQRVDEDKTLTCASFLIDRDACAFGFSDGSIRVGSLAFETSFLDEADVPETVRDELNAGAAEAFATLGDGIVQLTPERQYRLQTLKLTQLSDTSLTNTPIRGITHMLRASGQLICATTGSDADPRLLAVAGREKRSFMTGKTSFKFGKAMALPFEANGLGLPDYLALSAEGANLYAAWRNGTLHRIRTTDPAAAFVAEKGQLLPDDAELTEFGFLLGNNTLFWGDSKGRVAGGFLVRLEEFEAANGLRDVHRDRAQAAFALSITKHFRAGGDALRTLSSSVRSRLLLCGFDGGRVEVYNATSGGRVAAVSLPAEEPVLGAVMAPKENGVLAYTAKRVYHAKLDPRYPEANFPALFRPVWYEGYAEPQHMWQSSSATDDFEPKLGLMPLIFGTLKATFYSMLFGAPLALLAAIFSSEFLHPKARASVKPTVELMASLPSVVLGFLAALVFAPVAEKAVPATLCFFLTVPLAFLVAAYAWQLLPTRISLPLANWRVVFVVVPLALGFVAALQVGPVFENVFFSGDIKGWLAWAPEYSTPENAHFRDATGGWMILWTPVSICLTVFLANRFAGPYLRRLSQRAERHVVAFADFVKFAGGAVLMLCIAYGISALCNAAGWDPRGSYVDTFVQRNSLVVGIVMGFAIIPIIYTISDDALRTVPDHLRGASLGAGATKWQTTVRVIIPTAMSGLFSAMMIGLGRAVGETMIVLMAAGNTPVMEWNIFEGFRTLSANIAVELPEAVKDSAHYRTLFLAALVLFAMTFVVNTIAEIVRLRFRKRAVSL